MVSIQIINAGGNCYVLKGEIWCDNCQWNDIRWPKCSSDREFIFYHADNSSINRRYYQKFVNIESLRIHLPDDSEQDLKNYFLTYFSAQGCNVRTLESETFVKAGMLLTIILTENQINEINERAFVGLKNLEMLYLNNNRITKLQAETFHNLKSLKRIWLDHNELITIPFEVFENNFNLRELGLSGNKLFLIDLAFDKIEPNVANNLDEVFDVMKKNEKLRQVVNEMKMALKYFKLGETVSKNASSNGDQNTEISNKNCLVKLEKCNRKENKHFLSAESNKIIQIILIS